MAIVYQGDAGLVQGLNQGLGALSQALGHKMQQATLQKQFKNINDKIKDKELSPTLLQEILAEPGGQQYLQFYAPIVAPILKEKAKSQGAQQWLSSALPEIFGGQQPAIGAGVGGASAMDAAPNVSPIQEANILQSDQAKVKPTVTPTMEANSAQTNVPSISGVPGVPGVADSNRRGPQEQTVYQQGGQSGMGINPPQEGGDQVREQIAAAAQAQPAATPANSPASLAGGFDLSKLTPKQISILSSSPYQAHRDMAKTAVDLAKPNLKEESEIRKEDRAEIAKYSEPYRDLTMIDTSVKKLEKAKDLIQNRKVSLDQNQFRRLATAILEDEDYSAVAQYFKTDEQKMLFALLKDYFKTKDIGGSNPSTKEVLLSLSTLPSENLGQEANVALVNELLKDAKARQFKGNKINELRSSNKKYNFGEFQKMVEDDVKQNLEPLEKDYQKDLVRAQYSKQIGGKKPNPGYIWAVNPDGSLGQIPKQNAKKFEDAGGIIFNGK